ncbi:MAG: histidinol-phosphatase [Planctomycetota bacterium]|nr:MAG: histidinol-phosphatase [Planctomycetota bacterium]REJ93304.1 MAG: histidinol-phosphatase [Planctomycetota bacterium]REK30290.1 MAG: histidinol-phosphatase [Planctomycetota bacterium]REK49284.1 MAG: histidinol-phosphatase [Planctomycetota bacterium]
MSDNQTELTARLELAREIAARAGELTLRYFQDPQLAVERKSDASPVTVADREAEQLMRAEIAAHFSSDGIIGEEFGEQPGDSSYTWVLDPIDGTKSFIHGVPLYGTLVGLTRSDEAVAGVIQMAALDESVFAATGQGAWHQRGNEPPARAQVSTQAKLAESLFCTSADTAFAERADPDGPAAYRRLAEAAGLARTWGDCYGYFLVATGRADVMVDPVFNIWDACAAKPVIEEAGGKFTDWKGEATIHHGEGVATNGRVHDQVLAVLAGR